MGRERVCSCVDCGVISCGRCTDKYPDFCLTKELDEDEIRNTLSLYEEEENKEVMFAAAQVEYEYYGKMSRIKETIEFAKKIGAKKIGIAVCSGLYKEGQMIAKIFRSNGFEVYGVICKVGAVRKTEIGLSEEYEKTGPSMCNPIMQANILNKAKTDLNIVVGLCVGHDSLFNKYSEALTTTLIVKDRVTGHNPAAALYTSNVYYRELYGKEDVDFS